MELFKDGKRYKDFFLKVEADGKERSKELMDVNELRYRMMGNEKAFQNVLSGRSIGFVREGEGYKTTMGWNEVGK